MATVILDRCHLSLAADPSQQVIAYTNGRSQSFDAPGEVRRMAGGRLRTVRRAGSSTTIGVTFRKLTPAQVATLTAWAGRTVLFRDVWGRKLYGVYFTLSVADYRDRTGQDVALVLSEVTVSEAV